jgi:NMD protein affecting ribosome stability and mRNA decay
MRVVPDDNHAQLLCPRCLSAELILFSVCRSSAIYLCRDCELRWEVAMQGSITTASAKSLPPMSGRRTT